MLGMGKYIATFIGFLGNKISLLGDKAQEHPQRTFWGTAATGLVGWTGLDPAQVGGLVMKVGKFGEWLQAQGSL